MLYHINNKHPAAMSKDDLQPTITFHLAEGRKCPAGWRRYVQSVGVAEGKDSKS